MRGRLVLILALIAAIGASCTGATGSTAGPAAASPTAATPSGQVIGTLDMAVRVGFSCALPIDVRSGGDARILLPDGTVTLDQPYQSGAGIYGHAYRRGRWLAVPDSWVTPDGRSYAYPTFANGTPGQPAVTTIHLRGIGDGGDRQLWQGTMQAQVLGWGPGGLYFRLSPPVLVPNSGGTEPAEIWVVDPARPKAAHRVGPNPQPPQTNSGLPPFNTNVVLGGGAAWVTAQDPVPAGVKGGPNLVLRMDLREGTVSTWYTTSPGNVVLIDGVDAGGRPLLSVVPLSSPGARPTPVVLLLTGANQTTTIGPDPGLLSVTTYGDRHGTWITGYGSIWLYADGQLRKLATVPDGLFPGPQPKPGGVAPPIVQVVGPCA